MYNKLIILFVYDVIVCSKKSNIFFLKKNYCLKIAKLIKGFEYFLKKYISIIYYFLKIFIIMLIHIFHNKKFKTQDIMIIKGFYKIFKI